MSNDIGSDLNLQKPSTNTGNVNFDPLQLDDIYNHSYHEITKSFFQTKRTFKKGFRSKTYVNQGESVQELGKRPKID